MYIPSVCRKVACRAGMVCCMSSRYLRRRSDPCQAGFALGCQDCGSIAVGHVVGGCVAALCNKCAMVVIQLHSRLLCSYSSTNAFPYR